MQTPEFDRSLAELIRLSNCDRIAFMCAEAVAMSRWFIADALSVRGGRAEDIMSPTRRPLHSLTPFAKVCGITVTAFVANRGAETLTYPEEVSRNKPKKLPVERPRPRPTTA